MGTHNGSFHCDEALGCFLIRLTDNFSDAQIVRTRDPQVSSLILRWPLLLFSTSPLCDEGSMHTFVFLWTTALSPNEEDIPHGFIFATFMLTSMLGNSIASRLRSTRLLRSRATCSFCCLSLASYCDDCMYLVSTSHLILLTLDSLLFHGSY